VRKRPGGRSEKPNGRDSARSSSKELALRSGRLLNATLLVGPRRKNLISVLKYRKEKVKQPAGKERRDFSQIPSWKVPRPWQTSPRLSLVTELTSDGTLLEGWSWPSNCLTETCSVRGRDASLTEHTRGDSPGSGETREYFGTALVRLLQRNLNSRKEKEERGIRGNGSDRVSKKI